MILLLFNLESSAMKNPGYFTLGRKKKPTRLDISAPIPSTYVQSDFLLNTH
jgi:hypothetical protein